VSLNSDKASDLTPACDCGLVVVRRPIVVFQKGTTDEQDIIKTRSPNQG
jgi:hypothetical protein